MYNKDEVLWHYTTGSVFKRILKQGAILPDKTEPDNEKEIPTVTFSSDPVWERSRYRVGRMPDGRLIMMSKELLNAFDGGLFRIVVPKSIAPMDWHEMKDKCGVSRGALQSIYDFAIEVGARTRHWYGTTESIPEDVWLTVEKMDSEGNWKELAEDEIPSVDDMELVDSPVVDIPSNVLPTFAAN